MGEQQIKEKDLEVGLNELEHTVLHAFQLNSKELGYMIDHDGINSDDVRIAGERLLSNMISLGYKVFRGLSTYSAISRNLVIMANFRDGEPIPDIKGDFYSNCGKLPYGSGDFFIERGL